MLIHGPPFMPRYTHLPLTLLYSSLPKLFLLLLLSIWRPVSNLPVASTLPWPTSPYLASLPPKEVKLVVLRIMNDEQFDRAWVVRNVLGGMAAGFGLRGMCYLFNDVS
jgi:hypothetical protein